ncbi:hypothetical protein ACRQ5Q_29430 [Bradyrhizobium sp. PMVTL-01]|uniref:hypothetical protein n=1 Tax=Bradyrhizobium sp. PMVTL-01 TaxID=3434999 RepID=UPI003F70058F
MARRRVEGALLYLLLFLLTLAWAFWEVGANGWALVPRTVGPGVLLIFVLALTPKLHPIRHQYEPAATIVVGLLLLVATTLLMTGAFRPASTRSLFPLVD